MLIRNVVSDTDSYKYSQFNQYPEGTEYVESYIESRGGIYDKIVYFGLQMYLRWLAANPVTRAQVDRQKAINLLHGEPFYDEGWDYIIEYHDGRLPLKIDALDEGTIVDGHVMLVRVVNTDPNCWWLTSFMETALLRAVWYPTTVASNSYMSKKIIKQALRQTGDETLLPFKLHDFGARGVSSWESAGIGGCAHMVNFMGTDTMTAIEYAMEYYDAEMVPAYSVPAMEHSTVTSWTRENEVASYLNMIKVYGKPNGIVSIVSDSYDIFQACEYFGTVLKQSIIDSGATLVVRPDSGDPSTVLKKCMQILEKHFGYTMNDKGYKVLNNVRVLWGDGINHVSVRSILFTVTIAGYSADNVVFGQGGALLQMNNRDDLKFAMKCCAARVNGKWVDVYKDPITDAGKKSKKGRLDTYKIGNTYFTVRLEEMTEDYPSELKTRFLNGYLQNETNFKEVRARADQ